METVVAFNTELSGLYESKPPISKAKMTSITRSAMKAIKFYKHVVQSVEKFILKCKQEYKIPGLYVIDSIVRQSRHQFGTEKDVFAPRFARNMQQTFANLFQCSPEDKSKIIRVLNLWQKNNVFAPEVIQPLFDLADPNHPIYQNQGASQDTSVNGMLNTITQESPAPNMTDEGHTMSSDMSGPINSISNVSHIDPSTIRHLQQLMLIRQKNNEPIASTSSNSAMGQDSVKFNKKLLDFDYGDDEDDDNKGQSPRQPQQQLQPNSTIDNSNISQLLNDPNVLRQLHNLQKLKQIEESKQSKLAEMRMQEEAFEKQLATMLKKLPFANECDLSRQDNQIFGMQNANLNPNQNGPMYMTSSATDQAKIDPDVELVSDDGKVEVINLDGNSRSPSIDRDRYSKRRRSRSRSRDRRGRSRSRDRRRSRDRERRRSISRDRHRDRDRGKDKEKERERKRKGLPEIKKEHLSVCSTTLWIGHLSKLTQQEELSDIFTKYGDIVSIDMIHPRGCAFLVMHRRQDAYKAIDALNGYKLHGRVISISWAAGKGVKSKQWKDYWDLELGVSYIPWDKLDQNTDFEQLEDGGMFDEDSMPGWLKEKLKNQSQQKDTTDAVAAAAAAAAAVNQVTNMAMFSMDQPPPTQPLMPPNMSQMVPPFPMGSGPVPRFMPPMMTPGLPLGVPPPGHPMNGQMPMMIPQPIVPGMPMASLDKPPPGAPAPYFFPPIPQMPPMAAPTMSTSANISGSDDQMDIEEDETNQPADPMFQKNQPTMFNRPPPKIFGQNSMPSNDFTNQDNRGPNFDNIANNSGNLNLGDRDNEMKDFRGRGMERDRERDRENRNRSGNRRDYSNERGGGGGSGRNTNSRWSDGRGRSRENDRITPSDGNNRDFNNSRNNMQWRDPQPNFNNTFMDQSNPRMNMNAGPPPALEDMRLPIPIDNMRGGPMEFDDRHIIFPIATSSNNNSNSMNNNRGRRGGNDFDRNRMQGGQQRDFYNQNRFGPPGMNGPAGMNMRGGNMQNFGPRNNFMWQPRSGMNNDRLESNFNRNDRNRNNNNPRGPRVSNWKDNEDGGTPQKNRNHRNFDGQKDNRNSFSNFGDNSLNNEKQSKDGDIDGGDSDGRKQSESNEQSSSGGGVGNVGDSGGDGDGDGGGSDANETNESIPKPANEDRPFPRIQIKSPSKLAQEFSEKQKQTEAAAAAAAAAAVAAATAADSVMPSTNEPNRTNNNKSSVDLNTTPLYDEPTENRSYSLKETPSSQSFDSQNHESLATTEPVVAEVTDNSEH